MLRAGLRRLAILVILIAGATAAGSVLVGAITGTPLSRALSVGFYAVGSFGLVAGFFVGNRGPARGRAPTGASPFGGRRLRWARPDEQMEAITTSALFVTVGVVLILIGLAVDPRVRVM